MARIGAVRRPPGAAAARVAVFALATAGLLAGCGASSTSGGKTSSNPPTIDLARAAYMTNSAPGLRFSVLITARLAGKTQIISASGSLQTRTDVGSLELSLAGQHVQEIISDPYDYVKVPAAEQAVVGKSWIRVNQTAVTGTQGVSGESGSDPAQTLAYLRAGGSVRRVGTAFVRGVRTTRYHAVVNLHRYAQQAATASLRATASHYAALVEEITGHDTLPMDVYVDAQGRARRITVFESICTHEGQLTESVNTDFYDFAPQPAAKAPPASQVRDETAQASAALQQGAATLRCGTKVAAAAPK